MITDEKLSHWVGGGGYATTGAIGATAGSGGDVVDDCGLKFLLAMRQHTTLLRSLPMGHRASLENKVCLLEIKAIFTRLTNGRAVRHITVRHVA